MYLCKPGWKVWMCCIVFIIMPYKSQSNSNVMDLDGKALLQFYLEKHI